ncbi:hypothetical protein [Streptomyces sp. NPDC058193]|uniref:hypothetical protein n=1 Tax=Streptomyces sp. NPDC058193 TaxID=3346373 RepID=UPI0036E07E0E
MLVRLTVAAVLSAGPVLAGGAAAAPEPTPAPLLSAGSNVLPGQYVVTMSKSADATVLTKQLH